MAGDNSKEAKYRRSLEALGIYHEAMDPVIHDLCVLERECARTRKAWKATAKDGKNPSPLDDHYTLIRQQQRDILAMRTALGLTPMSLRRIRGQGVESNHPAEAAREPATVLELVRRKAAQG